MLLEKENFEKTARFGTIVSCFVVREQDIDVSSFTSTTMKIVGCFFDGDGDYQKFLKCIAIWKIYAKMWIGHNS